MEDAKNPFTTRHSTAPVCHFCQASGSSVQLQQCRVCHKRFCDECAFRSHKGQFCTAACGRIFFEGGMEEEPDDFDENKDYDDNF